MLCLVYNTAGEPLELVPSLVGLVLHLRGKAAILETVPGRVERRSGQKRKPRKPA